VQQRFAGGRELGGDGGGDAHAGGCAGGPGHRGDVVAAAAGVEARIVHIASDFIATCMPDMTGSLIGDKSVSVVFDNSKIKRFVPDFCATTRFARGIRQTIAWFDADPARQRIDAAADQQWDRLIGAYEQGLQNAKSALQG
jgi:hypothetical protein